MKISNLIFLSIFFILMMFTITTYINYKQSEQVRDNAEFLAVSSNVVRQSNQFQRNILNMQRDVKVYFNTKEEYLLQAFDSAVVENKSILQDLSASIPAEAPQSRRLAEMSRLYKKWINEVAMPMIARVDTAKSRKNLNSPDLNSLQKEEDSTNKMLQQQFRELLNLEYAHRLQQRIILDKTERQTKIISVLLTVLSIVVGFVIAVLLARHISKRISKMVRMANSISNGNYNVHVKDASEDELGELTQSLNHMARMLEENISLLQRKNKELDQFAYIVSHDLKAPLRGIDNLISWITEDHASEIPEKANEYLQLIKGRIARLEGMIQGILYYSKVGREVWENETVNLTELVRETVADLQVKPGITISIAENMPVIKTEKLPLTQVLTNLVSNAAKYNDKEAGMIKVYVKERKKYCEFYVEDNGPGIPEKYHDRIFVIFQTLAARDTFESTGVGLAIVKKILDERGEQIRIESEPGKGTTFIFSWKKN